MVARDLVSVRGVLQDESTIQLGAGPAGSHGTLAISASDAALTSLIGHRVCLTGRFDPAAGSLDVAVAGPDDSPTAWDVQPGSGVSAAEANRVAQAFPEELSGDVVSIGVGRAQTGHVVVLEALSRQPPLDEWAARHGLTRVRVHYFISPVLSEN